MEKQHLISVALSALIVFLLPLHQFLVVEFGNQEWLNMAIGLPIGLATAFNINIVIQKIRTPRK